MSLPNPDVPATRCPYCAGTSEDWYGTGVGYSATGLLRAVRLGLWTPEMKHRLMAADGSIQVSLSPRKKRGGKLVGKFSCVVQLDREDDALPHGSRWKHPGTCAPERVANGE
eukprot:706635-Rhodomonas_salina.2